MDDEQRLCKCHGEPMYRNGVKSPWRCAVRQQERNVRRVRMGAGGVELFFGYLPTAETCDHFRAVVAQAPRYTAAAFAEYRREHEEA